MSQAVMAVPIMSILELSKLPNTMRLELEVIWAASFAGFYWWTNSFGYTPSIHDMFPGGIITIWYGGI